MRAILLCLVFCAAACHPPKSGDTLGDSVRRYNEGVRWGRYEVAAIHVPAKERSQFVDEADQRSKDLKITDYEVVKVEQKGDRVAAVQVKMSWYKDSEGTLRETQAMQTWERHGKTWLIVDEARLRGTEMPGLREPPTTAQSSAPADQE
ncbi:MAG TPA: hypothetical protein VMZ53_21745 [Kofleriaceae bacterium]|nr:hypothetical protein [Kofleriaceae bacterium]